jgi:type VI secretion system secreted protein VgrG
MSTSTTTTTTTYTNVTITPDPGFTLTLNELTGTEELGRPFLYVALMSSDTVKGDLLSLLGSNMTVSITQNKEGDKRYFNGFIGNIEYAGLSGGAATYRIELRPWIWLLSHQQDCVIYQNQSPWTIITTVFTNAGFSAGTNYTDNRQNQTGNTPTLEYCVQYDESSFAFVTRLMEEFGIYYYYQHTNGNHTLVFCDDPNSHPALSSPIAFQSQSTELRTVQDHIWQWSSELAMVPGKFTYRDYNFTTPSADLTVRSSQTATHNYGSLEVYRYPGLYDTTANGTPLANVRIQELTSRRQFTFGTSNSRLLYTGCNFALSNFYDDAENTSYIIVRASYSVAIGEGMATGGGETRDTFRCSFQAVKATTNFRLANVTPRPRIRGPQTAVVVGASGDEICTDPYGRIKVQFPWDRVGQKNDNSSCWIRVAQIWAGASWGGIFIPRVGQEVVVEFLEGNPDRPIVTGCVYNATETVPYALPDNKTRSTIKTNSSTGGNGFNELRFEDKAGSEEVFFQAQKDYNKVVLNNETVNITQDTTTTVKQGNRSITISQGNNSLTVSQGTNTFTIQKDNSLTVNQGNNSVTVSTGNDSLTVSKGNHSITVSAGTSTINAAKSITLQVGSNSITIDSSGVSISAATFSVSATGEVSASAGGTMTLQGKMISLN